VRRRDATSLCADRRRDDDPPVASGWRTDVAFAPPGALAKSDNAAKSSFRSAIGISQVMRYGRYPPMARRSTSSVASRLARRAIDTTQRHPVV